MELIRYLHEYFLTREQLLAHCAVSADKLQYWQERRMMPKASYRLQLDIVCDSFFGDHREKHAIEYYAQGYTAWVDVLRSLDSGADAFAVFARRYRERLDQLSASGIAYPSDLMTDTHIAAEWTHFLDGTYGLCTASGLPEDIAVKEAAIAVIRGVQADCGQPLAESSRERLRKSVDLLDSASSPFAPHEVARSSRRRYVNDMRETHGL